MNKTGKDVRCIFCGKKFYLALWAIKQGCKFCSRSCYGKWRTKTLVGSAHPAFSRTLIECEICGRKFWIKKSEKEKGGRFCSYKCYHQWMIRREGEGTNNWRGGITPKNVKIRHSIEYRLWRESIFARDNWICQNCGLKGGKLNAHHIKNFSEFPELRFAIDNGITLCKKCHKKFHNIYGRQDNTEEQLVKFLL